MAPARSGASGPLPRRRRVVDVWIGTDYEGGRHDRRLDKISEFERNGSCGGEK
jgi:hypothetical protein